MEDPKVVEACAHLTEKFLGSQPYEALQYVQSFVARKKKALGRNKTSLCVFHSAKLFVDRDASSDAGTLLLWFLESEDLFHLAGQKGTEDKYCDTERILALLKGLPTQKACPVVDQIYGPLHQVVAKAGLLNVGEVSTRMQQFERMSADIFQQSKKWFSAYKVVVRLGDLERAAGILNEWSKEGYATEKPLFFARAVLQLLSEKKLSQAEDMVRHGKTFISDNVSPVAPGGPHSAPLAVWHLAVILSGLASLPPMQRVDKTRLFSTLTSSRIYMTAIDKTDPRLSELLMRVGMQTFGVQPQADMQSNPMAMLHQMMMASGNMGKMGQPGGSSSAAQQPDMGEIMRQLSRLESLSKKN